MLFNDLLLREGHIFVREANLQAFYVCSYHHLRGIPLRSVSQYPSRTRHLGLFRDADEHPRTNLRSLLFSVGASVGNILGGLQGYEVCLR